MRKLLAAALFLSSCFAFGQGVRYENIVLGPVGIPNPTVRVCTEPATGTPCSPIASIFSDSGLTNPLANPFTGDANGNFAFYANPSATYHVQISAPGVTTYDIPDITLPGTSVGPGTNVVILVNGASTANPTVNFGSTPVALANTLNVTFQKDALNPTNVSASIPFATGSSPGVIQLAGDLCTATGSATAPQVCATHLLLPQTIAQGGTGQITAPLAFNALAPNGPAGTLIVATGINQWGAFPMTGATPGQTLLVNSTVTGFTFGSSGASGVQLNPTGNQTVVQPVVAGVHTTLAVNDFNNIRYVTPDFNWLQSPSDVLTAPGAATVTLTPCPKGVASTNPDFYVYIAGTGTPETMKVTGGTCTSGAVSGTLTGTTVNAHTAGYTVGSATSGWKEASEYAKFAPTSPTGSPQGGVITGMPGVEYDFRAPFYIESALQSIDGNGSIFQCYSTLSCIHMGDDTSSTDFTGITVRNVRLRAMAANVGGIEDNSQGGRILNGPKIRNSATSSYFAYLVQNDNNQAEELSGLDTGTGTGWGQCTAEPCSVVVKGTGGANAGITYLHDSNLALSCLGNGVDWKNGNTLNITDTVIQGYPQWGVRATSGFDVNPAVSLLNVYEEVGSCSNPLGVGTAGLIVQFGRAEAKGMVGPAGKYPTLTASSSGATQFWYTIVPRSSTLGAGSPLLLGRCLSSGAGTCAVKWYQVGSAGTITYDVIRVVGDGSQPGPYVGGCLGGTVSACGSVALAVTTASCTANVCSLTDDVTANTAAYSPATATYFPVINEWSTDIVLSSASDTNNVHNGATEFFTDFLGGANGSIASTAGSNTFSVFAKQCATGREGNAVVSCQGGDGTLGTAIQPFISYYGGNSGGVTGGLKGLWLGTIGNATSIPATDLLTVLDSNFAKTSAGGALRATADVSDSAIGMDNASSLAPANSTFGIRGAAGISFRVGSLFDGSTWKEKLTTTTHQFQNLALQSLATATVDFSLSHSKPVLVGTVAAIVASSCSVGELAFATDATPGQNIYECSATNAWTQQLNTGVAGANVTLSNLTAPTAVNVALLPGTAGAVGLGSTTKPWSSLVFGSGSGTTAALAGTFTANRTITFPDADISVAGFNLSQTWTATQTLATVLANSVSTRTANPASAGFLRLSNTDAVLARNGANSGDVTVLSLDSTNNVYIGQTGAAAVRVPSVVNTLTSGLALTIQPTANTGNGAGGILALTGGNGAGTGANGDVVITGGQGGSGLPGIIQLNSGVGFPLTNGGAVNTQVNKLASYNSSGQVVITPAGSTTGLAGVCMEGCGTVGTAIIAKFGKVNLNLDNTGVPSHYVGISTVTNGFGTDCGVTACTTQPVGVVVAAVSGTIYTVDLLIGSGSAGGSSAFAVVTNPGVAGQTIQDTAATGVSLTVQCPSGAASNLPCLKVVDNTGANVWEAHQDGSQQFGAGTGGILTLQAVQSANSPQATAGVLRLNDTDSGMQWRNHANNANIGFAKDINDAVTLLNQSLFIVNPGRESLTETTAPTGTASADHVYADATFHALMAISNNTAVRRLGFTSTVRSVSATSDTILATDNDGIIPYTSASSIAVTVPQSTGALANHFCFTIAPSGGGTATLTPTTSTINGGASLAVASGKTARVCADGAGNYLALVGISSAGAGDMLLNSANTMGASGTLNGAAMSPTLGFILPSAAGASPTAAGAMSYDTTNKNPVFGNGTSTVILGAGIVNNQTGTSYTILTGDRNKGITYSNAASIAVTLPQAGASFPNGWCAYHENRGAGAVTITPSTSTIDGGSSITLNTNQGVTVCSDGTNYFVFNQGKATGLGDPGGNGMVARTAANSTINRTLTGTVNQITIANGDGVSGNPTFALDTAHVATDTNTLTLTGKTINGGSNTLTAIPGASLNNASVTSTQMAVVNTRRLCDIVIGDTSSSSALTNAQLGPQKRFCFIPYAATIVEIDISSDGGTPNIIIGRNRAGTIVNLLSSALATAAAGAIACSNTGGTTGIDGATTCSATLQNTSFNAGDYIDLVSGTAGGTAKYFAAHIVYTVN